MRPAADSDGDGRAPRTHGVWDDGVWSEEDWTIGDAGDPADGRAGQISVPAGALGGVERRPATLRSDPATLTDTGQIPDYQVPPRAFMLVGRFAVLALVTVLGLLATGSPWIVAFAGLFAIASLPAWAAVPDRSTAPAG